MKTIDDFKWKSKRVLLRVDLNSPIVRGKVELTDRFRAHVKTIKELARKKAKIVVLAHQARPKKEGFTSLEEHAKLLNRFLKAKFVNDIIGVKAVNAINNLKEGETLLLDNVRFLDEEFKPGKNNKLVKILAPLFDIYVNDAFSVAHRKQTSIVSFPAVLPSCAGRVMQKEVNAAKKLHRFQKPSVFILGGAKPEDNIVLMKKLGRKINKILACGIFGQYCRISKGFNYGAQNKYISEKLGYKPSKELAKLLKKNVELPIDFAVKSKGKRKDLLLKQFPSEYELFDIGPKTQNKYVSIIKKANSIFLKGTPGYSEEKQFAQGTKKILKAIEQSKAFSVVGGGHTTAAIKRLKINPKKFSHISLSGGALLKFIAGEKLPGLEALEKCTM